MWWERHNLPSTISCVTFYPGGRGVTSIWWPLTEVITIQLTINIYRRTRARIHTFFHHFTEIGQIFHIKHIFKINKLSMMKSRDEIIGRFARRYPRRMELANILFGMIQKPWKFPGGACPRTPLEPCGAHSGNRSVFILDLRLELSSGWSKGGLGCVIEVLFI